MKPLFRILLALCLLFAGTVSAQSGNSKNAGKSKVRKGSTAAVQYGTASFYANKFNGRPTANGEIYDSKKLTAAHNALPLGTWVRVTNLRNRRSVVVKINDRLHHKNQRLVDLSRAAAKKLGYTGRGLTRVKLEVLSNKTDESIGLHRNK
ncbi:MAG TPA: septal ring lytic transglycosylase RlpA family protein [Flavihumibacter sp.]|nr:septal ring lytic transglycosylase RlpA family protein [Bacteroidota bacterium]HOA39402.1 septal ring lytic transglycosylase RlpA family protein [Flavihumibacter sp.]HQD10193.1 septal ring lytic transglycosylase RlpA family protein [Flavihumibacter sp.]